MVFLVIFMHFRRASARKLHDTPHERRRAQARLFSFLLSHFLNKISEMPQKVRHFERLVVDPEDPELQSSEKGSTVNLHESSTVPLDPGSFPRLLTASYD